ncbi:MAG: hypothetical protein JSU07_01480 [Bacteroidetes bacterium]|nr:hypothetical protein [Bacteroidota bacterium]
MFSKLLNRGLRGGIGLLLLFFAFSLIGVFFEKIPIEIEFKNEQYLDIVSFLSNSKISAIALNYLVILLNSFLVYKILISEEITTKHNLFSQFIYLLICVVCVNPYQISSYLIASGFTLFSLYKIISYYRIDNALKSLFESAFWLGFSFFISITNMFFLPVFFISLLILRPFVIREWLVFLVGLIVPAVMYECFAYLTNLEQGYVIKALTIFYNQFKFPVINEYFLPFLFLFGIIFLLSLINLLFVGLGNNVKTQKFKKILFWYLPFCFFVIFSKGSNATRILIILSLPLSLFIGEFLSVIKAQKIIDTIMLLLIFSGLLIKLLAIGVI